jgi:hypothetical protein
MAHTWVGLVGGLASVRAGDALYVTIVRAAVLACKTRTKTWDSVSHSSNNGSVKSAGAGGTRQRTHRLRS